MSSGAGLRMVGVSVTDVSDWREPVPQGQWSKFFGALARRFELLDVIDPELSRVVLYLNYARTFHPDRAHWRARATLNPFIARKRTEAVQRALAERAAPFDVVMQVQTLCAPGFDRGGVPYVLYTDNTMALTRRHYPAWAPLSDGAAARWMSYEAEVCRAAAAVFTFSEFARRSIIEDYGDSPERVVSVVAGANQMLESLGEKDYAAPRALFVGRDFERKGGPVLLDAWQSVRAHVPEAELTIAGPAQAPSGALPPGVAWVGVVDRAALDELYRSASVFVLPSLFDPCPNVFREAMGYGVPCIGTRCCAIPEIIDDGVTGRVVPVGQSEPLAAALAEMLSLPQETAAMGAAAYASVLQGGRWSDVADRIAAHLEKELDGRPPARRAA